MPKFEIDDYLDINPDEFLIQCSDKEIKDVIDILITEGHIDKKDHIDGFGTKKNIFDTVFGDIMTKLRENRLKITNDDMEGILSILKKY